MKHLPNQYLCTRCERSKVRCDFDFSTMKVVGEYAGVSYLVKCNKFKKRLNDNAINARMSSD